MSTARLSFSIARHAAWAPGVESASAWLAWAQTPHPFAAQGEPKLAAMPPMLRRRAGFLGKMALEVAYQCSDGRRDLPTVFCSRHGEVARAVALISDLVRGEPLSPTGFGLAVHNASAGLFSIARADQANHLALAAGASSVEHAVIEACSLLADGNPEVLLVVYDDHLPSVFSEFEDCQEQSHAWAWLMVPAAEQPLHLEWRAGSTGLELAKQSLPASLALLQFQLSGASRLEREVDGRHWCWSRDA
ncbi:beta-ketoacyl synthase chain length factor [Undibacterium sp. Ren11W]|uniref:beta-ketoacyl synthase chain length factor n=1 Tax=Undibacterium sp. Ren11W TaxID=3413045 RepID=UPI003BF135F4